MTNNVNHLAIPIKHHFVLDGVCELVQINPSQFAQWQHESDAAIGYGGNRYTHLDVVKLLKSKDTFAPFVGSFSHSALDSEENPAADAKEVRAELKTILTDLEKTLVN